MKIRNITIILLLVLLSFLMTSCGVTKGGSAFIDEANYTVVIDSFGREVKVPEKVERIAALYSFAGYAVCLLGSGNDLVAVPGGLQRDVLLGSLFPKILDASVPRSGGAINIEELLRIKPDLVIIRGDTAVDEKEKEKLDKSGLPYIIVEFSNIKEQQEAISIIGEALGKAEEAEIYNAYYDNLLETVEQIVRDIPAEERIRVYHSENQALRTTHENSLSADLSRAAGIINVSIGEDLTLQGNDYYASIEQVLLWDPEIIIANEIASVSMIKSHPHWSGVRAVQEGKVYKLPQGISRWGHPGSVETPLALLWIANTAYPEKFNHIDMKKEIAYYYKTFFNVEIEEEMIELILKGEDLRDAK